MSNTSIDSQTATKSSDTNWQVTVGPSFGNIEVANIGGAGILTVKLGITTAVTNTNGQADNWYIPATAGASRVWTFTDGDPSYATNRYLAISTSATNQIAVTAW